MLFAKLSLLHSAIREYKLTQHHSIAQHFHCWRSNLEMIFLIKQSFDYSHNGIISSSERVFVFHVARRMSCVSKNEIIMNWRVSLQIHQNVANSKMARHSHAICIHKKNDISLWDWYPLYDVFFVHILKYSKFHWLKSSYIFISKRKIYSYVFWQRMWSIQDVYIKLKT